MEKRDARSKPYSVQLSKSDCIAFFSVSVSVFFPLVQHLPMHLVMVIIRRIVKYFVITDMGRESAMCSMFRFSFILFTCMFTCIAGSVPFLCVLKLRNSCALLLLFATDTQTERERERKICAGIMVRLMHFEFI